MVSSPINFWPELLTKATTTGEQAQGPGFTDEGGFELGAGLRMHDQKFGDDHTSGPALKPQDETSD